MDYNPAIISYEKLLEIFWISHDPSVRSWSKQYRPIIVYHNDKQKRIALESKAKIEEKLKSKTFTEIIPASRFYIAEDYHQKHYLREAGVIIKILKEVYPSDSELVESMAAARLNGCIYSGSDCPAIKSDLKAAGLPPETIRKILAALNREDFSH